MESAKEKLSKLNPWIDLDIRKDEINEETLPQLMDGCDLVLDGLDNFPTRYLINQQILRQGIPFIYGGILGMMGMATDDPARADPLLEMPFSASPSAPEISGLRDHTGNHRSD